MFQNAYATVFIEACHTLPFPPELSYLTETELPPELSPGSELFPGPCSVFHE